MKFLDKVKKVASEVATVSGKQGKKFYSIAKLNLEIVEKQNKVKELYKDLGFEVYKSHNEGTDILENTKSIIGEIDELVDKIAILRKTIDDVKNTEEVGIYDRPIEDSDAVEADFYDGQSEFVEAETEPIE